jgi:CheY-like chemotaxis protein
VRSGHVVPRRHFLILSRSDTVAAARAKGIPTVGTLRRYRLGPKTWVSYSPRQASAGPQLATLEKACSGKAFHPAESGPLRAPVAAHFFALMPKGPRADEPEVSTTADGPKKILIVDDDPEIVEILRRCLEGTFTSYTIQTVTNGTDAVAAIAADTPDLVLLDINMPGLNGLEVMKQIDRQIPVMIVSGNTDAAPGEALKFGAFAYIPKPFDIAYVEQLVPLALMRRRVPKPRSIRT